MIKIVFMNRLSLYIPLLLIGAVIGSCKSYSKYMIDEHPVVKIDSGLLGIWKAVEDTNKKDYMLLQSRYDLFHHVVWWTTMDSVEKRSYIDPEYLKDTAFVNHFYFRKDLEALKGYYKDFIKRQDHEYAITRMDGNGRGAHYQQWGSFLSKVGDATFFNIMYNHTPDEHGEYISEKKEEGYFFLRLIRVNKAGDTMITAVVADTAMRSMKSSKAVRNRIAKNLNNPAFYSDTLHFYKVSGYHLSLWKSVEYANKKN